MAVLEAENRAKVEALVEFQVILSQAVATAQGVTQERLNNTQRELRAALAQNQKYEEVVSQRLVWLGF